MASSSGGRRLPASDPRYEELEQIGRGSQGAAYTARSLTDGSLLVLKRLRIGDERQRSAALREAEHMRMLAHTAVVGCRECFLDGDELCIAMEYCEGGDLRRRIELAQMSGVHFAEEQVLMWLIQLALALHHVHERGLLHRDLKSENVFISSAGLLKLGDFGISRGLGAAELAATVVGTPFYMSPELFRGEPYSHPADVWGLGCILVEMCCQRRAFEADNFNALSLRVMRGSFHSLPPQYSDELHMLVRSLLNVNPASRPSVADLLSTPCLRRHIASYALAALGGFSLEAQLASPSLAALRSQLSSAGLNMLLNEITPSVSSPVRRRGPRATPSSGFDPDAIARQDRVNAASALTGPGYSGEVLVQQLLNDEQERLRVELALRKLDDERKSRLKKQQHKAQAERSAGVGGPARAGTSNRGNSGGGECSSNVPVPGKRVVSHGRRALRSLSGSPDESSAEEVQAVRPAQRRAGPRIKESQVLKLSPSQGQCGTRSPMSNAHPSRDVSPPQVLELSPAVSPPHAHLAPYAHRPSEGRRQNVRGASAGSSPRILPNVSDHRLGDDLIDIPATEDVFAGFHMPTTAGASGAISSSFTGLEREMDGMGLDGNDGDDGGHASKNSALLRVNMDYSMRRDGFERHSDEFAETQANKASDFRISAKDRVLARRARHKLEEEEKSKAALEVARRQYFAERQEADQMLRDQYRGGLNQAYHVRAGMVDATLGQVGIFTEPLTPQRLRFAHA